MAKRGVAGPAYYVAYNSVTGERVTGDVANHTIAWVKDGVATAATNAPFEVSAVLAPGLYCVMRTAEESDCALGVPAGTSSTDDVELFGVAMSFDDWATYEDVADAQAAVIVGVAEALPSTAEIVAALYASTATSGGASFAQVCDFLTAMAKGKFTEVADNTYTWYADDGSTVLFTLIASPTGRTSA